MMKHLKVYITVLLIAVSMQSFAGMKSDGGYVIRQLIDSAKVYVDSAPLKSIDFLQSALKESEELQVDHFNNEIYMLLGDLYFKNRSYERANTAYNTIIEKRYRPKKYKGTSSFKKSADKVSKFEKGASGYDDLEYKIGLTYQMMGDNTKALEFYQKGIQQAKLYNDNAARMRNEQAYARLSELISERQEQKQMNSSSSGRIVQSYDDVMAEEEDADEYDILEDIDLEESEEAPSNDDGSYYEPSSESEDIGDGFGWTSDSISFSNFDMNANATSAEKPLVLELETNEGFFVPVPNEERNDSALEPESIQLENIKLKEEIKKKDEEVKKEKITRILDNTFSEAKSLEKDISISKQRKEIETKETDFRNLLIGGLVFVALILIVALVLITKSARESKIANKKLALKSLRTQMNPHFIFNALNSVNNFISLNDERAANKYLADFSRLMRSVLENSEFEAIPIRKEVEILELYLKLEHFRFQDKFEYTFEVDEELDLDYYSMPPMLIQPYIENAVWHGLRYLEDKGNLTVTFKDAGENILVTVKDDGIGRQKSKEIKTKNQNKNTSTGLKNIELRLSLLNDLGSKEIGVDISDLKEDGTGTFVEIVVPKTKVAI